MENALLPVNESECLICDVPLTHTRNDDFCKEQVQNDARTGWCRGRSRLLGCGVDRADSDCFVPAIIHTMLRFTAPAYKKFLQPLGERVLVKRTLAAKETKAGILIPEQIAGKVNEGTVVSVAAASKDWTPSVKAGDVVLLPDFGGHAVKIEGEEFHLFDEGTLLGVVTQK